MKHPLSGRAKALLAAGLLVRVATFASSASAWAAEQGEYRTVVTFVEGCSCSIPCTCDMSGVKHGCQGVGAVVFASGTYNGVNLAGAKIAYATAPGNWIRLYVEAKSPQQEEAAAEFGKATFKDYGKLEGVKKASVTLSGKAGRYTLSVDGGRIMELTTEPVLGADKKAPMAYSNVFQPLSPTVMQGKTVKGSYHDGEHSFTLGGTNAYFNGAAKSSGKV